MFLFFAVVFKLVFPKMLALAVVSGSGLTGVLLFSAIVVAVALHWAADARSSCLICVASYFPYSYSLLRKASLPHSAIYM
jgi:hypothetical protein